jgi:hypothetical protein
VVQLQDVEILAESVETGRSGVDTGASIDGAESIGGAGYVDALLYGIYACPFESVPLDIPGRETSDESRP